MVRSLPRTAIVVEFKIAKIKENVDMSGPRSIARRFPLATDRRAALAADGGVDREILAKGAL
jgi:hypothetical protein